jgi:SAM-dependent methyltransferase
MCDTSCIIFAVQNLTEKEIRGKRILEVGSLDVNGSLRPIIELWNPSDYVGIDIEPGPGVDKVCDAEQLLQIFPKESFDIVISTEMLEHARNWRKVISNIKALCKPKGIILITTRSFGRAYHAYPYDFWRFEVDDMQNIFADCIIDKIENDKLSPGVFLKAIKPESFIEKDLSGYNLFSIIARKKLHDIDDNFLNNFLESYAKRKRYEQQLGKLSAKFKSILYKLIC